MAIVVPDKQTAYALQQVARHKFIHKMLAEILFDMNVCKLEGWDCMEHVREIERNIAHIVMKYESKVAPTKFRGRSCVREDGTYKSYTDSPVCSACDSSCGFYRDTCPSCGAKLDRKHVEELEIG